MLGCELTRRKAETSVEFECVGDCATDDEALTWPVAGRWNADGDFEPTEPDDMNCDTCGIEGEPSDSDIIVAE